MLHHVFFDTVTGVMILVLENFSLWKISPQLKQLENLKHFGICRCSDDYSLAPVFLIWDKVQYYNCFSDRSYEKH